MVEGDSAEVRENACEGVERVEVGTETVDAWGGLHGIRSSSYASRERPDFGRLLGRQRLADLP